MDFIAFDTETTGLSPETDKIIELAAARFVNGEPVDSLTYLIDPQKPIPPDATAIHGISDEMVKGKPLVQDCLHPFAEFCGDLPLVAHNATFDYNFISKAVTNHLSPAPKGILLDSLAISRRVLSGMFNYKLETLVDFLDIPKTQAHRALDDSIYCGHLFFHLMKIVHKRGDPVSEIDLLKLSKKDELRFPQIENQSTQMKLF